MLISLEVTSAAFLSDCALLGERAQPCLPWTPRLGPQSPPPTPTMTQNLFVSDGCANFPRFLVRKAKAQRNPLGRLQPDSHAARLPSPASSLLRPAPPLPQNPALLRTSIFHNGKQKPSNAQLPTFHRVLTALLTARSTAQEQ